MFGKRGATKTQAKRDEEWRLLVRSITHPEGASEADEARFRAYLEQLGGPLRRRRLWWMTGRPDRVDRLESLDAADGQTRKQA
jgi:hypothetical protein